jgi:tetratricopeptide (TPR) repeat protein
MDDESLKNFLSEKDYDHLIDEVVDSSLKEEAFYKFKSVESNGLMKPEDFKERDRKNYKRQWKTELRDCFINVKNLLKEGISNSSVENPTLLQTLLEKLDDKNTIEEKLISFDLNNPKSPYQLLNIDEDEFDALLHLGQHYFQGQRAKDALDIFHVGILFNPESFKAWQAYGVCNFFLNNLDISIYSFRRAHDLHPNDINPVLCLLEVYTKSNNLPLAKQLYNELHRRWESLSNETKVSLNRIKKNIRDKLGGHK